MKEDVFTLRFLSDGSGRNLTTGGSLFGSRAGNTRGPTAIFPVRLETGGTCGGEVRFSDEFAFSFCSSLFVVDKLAYVLNDM